MAATVNGTPTYPPTRASSSIELTSIASSISDAADFKNAIGARNIGAVRALVEKGANVNSRLPGKGTALQIALQVAEPQIECVRMLLEEGSDIYYTEDDVDNALVMAVIRGLDNVLDLMVDGGYVQDETDMAVMKRGFTILHVAACCRNERAIKRLLETPAVRMVNHRDHFGQTPLHHATKTYSKAMNWLGTITNSIPSWRVSPAFGGDGEPEGNIARLLVASGARGDVPDNDNRTALEQSFESFEGYNVAKILFPASVHSSQ